MIAPTLSVSALEVYRTSSLDTKQHINDLSAHELLRWAGEFFGKGLMMSSSFGIQSAVTLHLATQVRPDIPVIWIDTGYLPEETYRYVETLHRKLNLNLQVYQSELSPEEMEQKLGVLWQNQNVDELELYDWIRKVEPMQRAIEEWRPTGWISGLRADQTAYRKQLGRVIDQHNRFKILPILNWTSKEIYEYMQRHDLPQHPLWEQGYTTVGDWHSSRAMTSNDSHERDTRFQGLKQECGIHTFL